MNGCSVKWVTIVEHRVRTHVATLRKGEKCALCPSARTPDLARTMLRGVAHGIVRSSRPTAPMLDWQRHAWLARWPLGGDACAVPLAAAGVCAAAAWGRTGTIPELVDEITARVWYALVADDGKLLERYDPSRGARLITFLRALTKGVASGYFRRGAQTAKTRACGARREIGLLRRRGGRDRHPVGRVPAKRVRVPMKASSWARNCWLKSPTTWRPTNAGRERRQSSRPLAGHSSHLPEAIGFLGYLDRKASVCRRAALPGGRERMRLVRPSDLLKERLTAWR